MSKSFLPQNVTEQMQYTHMKEAQEKALKGQEAIEAVQELIGRELTANESKIVNAEGYSPDYYLDTKDIITRGVGQTQGYLDQDFDQVMKAKDKELRAYITDYDNLNPRLQDALFSNNYRGSLGGSKLTRGLINKGKFSEAADEFLRNDEYLDPETSQGIKNRFEETAAALREQAEESIQEESDALGKPAGYGSIWDTFSDPLGETYTSAEGDNPYNVAKNNGMTPEDFYSLNPEYASDLNKGVMPIGQEYKVGENWFEKLF